MVFLKNVYGFDYVCKMFKQKVWNEQKYCINQKIASRKSHSLTDKHSKSQQAVQIITKANTPIHIHQLFIAKTYIKTGHIFALN